VQPAGMGRLHDDQVGAPGELLDQCARQTGLDGEMPCLDDELCIGPFSGLSPARGAIERRSPEETSKEVAVRVGWFDPATGRHTSSAGFAGQRQAWKRLIWSYASSPVKMISMLAVCGRGLAQRVVVAVVLPRSTSARSSAPDGDHGVAEKPVLQARQGSRSGRLPHSAAAHGKDMRRGRGSRSRQPLATSLGVQRGRRRRGSRYSVGQVVRERPDEHGETTKRG